MAKNNFNKIFNCVAFLGLALIAIALILSKIFQNGTVINAMSIIGQSIAYIITAISAFFYVRTKRNVWWYVVYTVFAVLVVVFMIL